jgi:hypothetical protein
MGTDYRKRAICDDAGELVWRAAEPDVNDLSESRKLRNIGESGVCVGNEFRGSASMARTDAADLRIDHVDSTHTRSFLLSYT